MNVVASTQSQPKELTFGRILRRLPLYFGLALASLLLFTLFFALSIHFGIVGKIRGVWIGFAMYTALLFWIAVTRSKPHWYRWNFWLVVLGMLATHCSVFIAAIRVYPEWRVIWFWPITVIEGGIVGGIIEWLFPEKHRRHHRAEEL